MANNDSSQLNDRNIYQDSPIFVHVLIWACAIGMTAVSLYLTSHFFKIKFPTGLTGERTICNINQFFNCDVTTLSPLGSMGGVPTALFGILMGISVLIGYLFNGRKLEGTVYTILAFNLLGCVGLFFYSLVGLGGLCPMCALYYALSFGLFFVFHKFGLHRRLAIEVLAILAIPSLALIGGVWNHSNQLEGQQRSISKSLIEQFYSYPNLGTPQPPSPFRLTSATEVFEEAPLQLTIFSDFQCPACRALSEQIPKIIRKYQGKINIQYMYYPLDMECNSEMKRPLHTLSCMAAYITTCVASDKFTEVHDRIFENQNDLSSEWLTQLAKGLGVLECMSSPETKKKVQSIVAQAATFTINSTPTLLVNGVKIEGVLPAPQLYTILDDLLDRNQK